MLPPTARHRLPAALLALTALLLAGTQPLGFADERVPIEVWHYYGDRAGKQVWQDLKEGFEKTRPGIEVNLLCVPWNNPQKLLTAIVGGVPPDVTMIDRPGTSKWASRGALVALDDLIRRDNFDGSKFFETTWEETLYQGHRWTIPFNTDARALFYNKKAFEEAGLDPDRPPTTWKELEEYSAKLTEKDAHGRIIRVGFAPISGYGGSLLYTYAWQKGGDVMNPDCTRVTFNSPEWVSSLEWVVGIVERHGLESLITFSSDFGSYAQDPFITGRIAMQEHGCWYLKQLRKYAPDLQYGVAEIPIPEGGKPAFLAAGFSLGIPRGAKHVEEAWEFIKYCTDTEPQIIIGTGVENIPANIAAAHSPHYMNDPVWKSFVDRMVYSRHHPISPVVSMTFNDLIRAIDMAIHGEKSPKEALDEAASRVQEELDRNKVATVYPQVNWGNLLHAAIPVVFILVVAFLWYARRRLRSKMALKEALEGYLLASPWLLALVLFTAGPILISIVYSVCDYQVLTPARYLGVANYKRLVLHDDLFRKSLYNTLYYTVLGVPLGLTGSLLLAMLLNSKVKCIRFFRTVFYTPAVVSGVAVCVLWMWLLNPDSGLINTLLAKIGVAGPLWLGDKHWSKPAIILMGLWGVGGGMVIFLAGLQGIPAQLYEAAKIDGAGRWRTFLNVTVPMLSPTIFFNLIMGVIMSFQIFTQAYVMTSGGPVDSTLFYALYLFRQAFEYFNMGYASALAWVLFLIVLFFTLLQLWVAKRWVYYEGGTK